MNERPESEFEISVPEGVLPEEAVPEAPAPETPVPEVPGSATYVLPEGYITAEAPEPPVEEAPAEPPPAEEPPIVRHDPFAWMRGAPWMNRNLSPSGRAAAFLRRELDAFPVIEGRDPNRADLDAIVKRTVDYMVPIFKRERATDIAYDELEKRRAARIAKRLEVTPAIPLKVDSNIVLVGAPREEARDVQTVQAPAFSPKTGSLPVETIGDPWEGTPVILPNGKTVPNEYSRAGLLMSPFADLSEVAAVGRKTFRDSLVNWLENPLKAKEAYRYAVERVRKELGQGGRFDYQRLWIPDNGDPDYLQLPQFRDVANFNVGLFMQQALVPLDLTLAIAGDYAREHSSNYRPERRFGLERRTREWIERGYEIGESGMFTPAPAPAFPKAKR